MYERREGFFQGSSHNKLFLQIWNNPNARGSILITHGQGEHTDCYHRLVNYFAQDPVQNSWDFYAWDLRGHGRSEGKRGYVRQFSEYVEDFKIFVKEIRSNAKFNKGPVILLSHSMGGEVQLKALIEHPQLIPSAQIYSAPLLGLSLEVPAIKKQASLWLNRFTPTVTLSNGIENGFLTRDPNIIAEYEADVLRHDRVSAGAFLGMVEGFDFIRQHASQLQGPILFQCPEEDPVVSTSAAKEVFALLGSEDKVLLTYGNGARHEMYNDIHRTEVFSDLKRYLDRFLKGN